MSRLRNLRLAIAQFPVSNDVARNLRFMRRQVAQATKARAHLVHFPEAALTGYFSKDFEAFGQLDWDAIDCAEERLVAVASAAKVWMVFGTYRRSRNGRPFNSLRVAAPSGGIVATYDKHTLFDRNRENVECSPGKVLRTVVVQGVVCGFLICNDSNRESLYQRYSKLGVKVLLHSYYNARSTKGRTAFDEVILGQLRTRAFDHRFWISASNSSARHSTLPACLAAPNGTVTAIQRHRAGIHIADIPLSDL